MGLFGRLYHANETYKVAGGYVDKMDKTVKLIKKFLEDSDEKYVDDGYKEGWNIKLDYDEKYPLNYSYILWVLCCLSMQDASAEATKNGKSEDYKEAIMNAIFGKVAEHMGVESRWFSQHITEKILPKFLSTLGKISQSEELGALAFSNELEIKAAAHTITEGLFTTNAPLTSKYGFADEYENNSDDYSDFKKERYSRHYEETCARVFKIICRSFKVN